jgi:hypothetical protein
MSDYEHALGVVNAIDAKIYKDQKAGQSDNDPRFYCGASAIGTECARARWYDFRWATDVKHEARMLRLFDRGHSEEYRVMQWLGLIGVEIRATSQHLLYHDGSDSYILGDWDVDYDAGPDTPDDVTDLPWHVERAKARGLELKQWSFKAHGGHFSGHTDAKLRFVPGQDRYVPADEWIIFECKTHNAKSFADIAGTRKDREKWKVDPVKYPFPGKGVCLAKPEHVVQSQHYMHHLGARLALYVAVNKDDDDIHVEFLPYEERYHIEGEPIIRETIHSPRHPRRISSSPSWYKCKGFCDHWETCHNGKPMRKSCRTCGHSMAVDGGNWICTKWNNAVIPREAQLVGCGNWLEIKD